MGAKFFAARTHLLWGRMFLDRHGPGDDQRARELLTTARAIAEGNGYGNVARRAVAALRRLD
jgi:hypothetical protein